MIRILLLEKLQGLAWKRQDETIKHLMTGPKGNSEFCAPRS